MESPFHSLTSLFDQLGIDSTDQAIENFIDGHRPLQGDIELHEADFWSAAQASFLKQEKTKMPIGLKSLISSMRNCVIHTASGKAGSRNSAISGG